MQRRIQCSFDSDSKTTREKKQGREKLIIATSVLPYNVLNSQQLGHRGDPTLFF